MWAPACSWRPRRHHAEKMLVEPVLHQEFVPSVRSLLWSKHKEQDLSPCPDELLLTVPNRGMPRAFRHLLFPSRDNEHVTFSTTLHLTPSPVFALCNTDPQIALWDWYILRRVSDALCLRWFDERTFVFLFFFLRGHNAAWRTLHARSHRGVGHQSKVTRWTKSFQFVINRIATGRALKSFKGDRVKCRFNQWSSRCR